MKVVPAKQQAIRVSPQLNIRLSPCANKYLRCLSMPFDDIDEVCIPDMISLPSFKTKWTSRGTFAAGTTGFGYVSLNPYLMAQSSVAVNPTGTQAPINFSLSTYTGTVAHVRPTTTSVNTAFAGSNSQYSMNDLVFGNAQNFSFRLVGAGLRVRFIGTNLNQGGRLILFRNRNNIPAAVDINVNNVLTDIYYSTDPVDRSWREVTYAPASTDDANYEEESDPTTGGIDYRIMYALVEGVVPGQSFEFEAIGHFEYIGGGVLKALPVTVSHADPVGYGAVISSLPSTFKSMGMDLLKYMTRNTLQALAYTASGFAPPNLTKRATARLTAGPVVTDAD